MVYDYCLASCRIHYQSSRLRILRFAEFRPNAFHARLIYRHAWWFLSFKERTWHVTGTWVILIHLIYSKFAEYIVTDIYDKPLEL
jgi:hypothetical protein